MEDQEKDGKIEAACDAATVFHRRNGSDQGSGARKRIKNEKNSNMMSDSTYPSSSSYSTAEEDPAFERNPPSNGGVSSSIQNSKRNASVEHLQAHIHHLEDVLAGKEAALIAITQELDAVREMSCIDASIGPLAAGFDTDFKASVAEYNRKLQEHASALCQRDEMIQKLAESLKQSVRDREELKKEAGRLTDQVHSLQTQLHSVGQHVQNPQTKLLEALKEKDALLQKKSIELTQYKAQSSKEVQFLMSSLEELQQRAARSTSSSPPVLKSSDEAERRLSRELKDFRIRYETDKKHFADKLADAQRTESLLRAQVTAAQKECEKLNLDISSLKLAHETQLSVCRDHHQGIASSEHQQKLEAELRRVAELESEIQLLRLQGNEKDELNRKQGDRIQLLQSQAHEYATDITTCHQTLEQYKKRIDELQTKHSEEMAQRDSSQHSQITHLNQRIAELQEIHSRQLQSMHQDLNRMKQRQMEELATMQLSHENEVNTSKRDAERYRNELREKNNLLAMQEEQLEVERQWSRTYSQQVQELGEKLNEEEDKNEEYREKIELLEQRLKELSEACTLYQPQIEFLHQQLKDEHQKLTDVMQQLDDLHKQLSLEQEKCKAYITSLDAANSNIRELQNKNSELQVQVSKLDEGSKEKIKCKEQQNASLQKELKTVSENLKQEQSRAHSYKEAIDTLHQQIKLYSSQEKDLKDMQENEKQSSVSYKSHIEALNLQLDSLKSKNCEDCQKLHTEIQENQAIIKKYKQETENFKKELLDMQEANMQQKKSLEHQISELTEGSRKSQKNSLEIEERSQQTQSLSDKYLEQVKSLELKLKVLSDVNSHLKKEREESEVEFKKLKDLYDDSRHEFETVSCGLRENLSLKDEEILKLRNEQEDLVQCKKEINAYNRQVKELMCAKVSLESEIALTKEEYCKEIEILKDQVVKLENKLKTCNRALEDENIESLVRKCRDDIEFLRSHCSPNDCVSNPETSTEIKMSRIPGLTALEKLVDICEKCSNYDQREAKTSEVMSGQLSKLAYTVEKMELELEVCYKQKQTLQLAHDELLAKIETLESENKHVSLNLSDLPVSGTPPVPSKISDLITSCAKRCEDVDKSNIELKSTISILQANLTEVEGNVSPNRPQTKSLGDIIHQRCNCEKQFSEERSVLRNSIEVLQKELTNKDLQYEDRIKNILKKSKNSNQSNVGNDDLPNLINDFSCKVKETILLQNELHKVKLENQLYSYEKRKQKELFEKSQTSLEKMWQECCTLKDDFYKMQRENKVLHARLLRVQTLYDSVKTKTTTPNQLMLQLIEELSSEKASLNLKISSEDNPSKSSVMEKIKSILSIINKMNTDCEATLVKLQNGDDDSPLCGYLQSEALGLRRLQSLLLETNEVIASKCGPAIQLHVDVLNQQLEEKDYLYQDVCQSLYTLEAEMREMEEQFQQQDEHLQEQVRKHKAAARYWQLKAQGAQAQILTLQLVEQSQGHDLSSMLSEMESVYSQALSTCHDELERVARLRENKVRLELSEKFLSAEKRHKQQMEELGKQVQANSTVRALQVLHQEEIDAVRAECDYARFKAIEKLQQDVPSSLKLPYRVNPNTSCTELSLLLMKHSISSEYNTAVRKVSTSLFNEMVQRLSQLEQQLDNASSNKDPDFDVVIPDLAEDTPLSFFEQLIGKVEELGEKLLKMQTTGLQSVLSVCEENHKQMSSKVQSLITEFDAHCDVRKLQEQLMRLKEEHQLALESISTSHKAEVSRLRLLLSQQSGTESSDANETALSVLRRELEEKHKRQMEELRTYFEQKCADFEKHYSEEVFSQHSRKLSDCSSASESELVSEMYYAGPGSSICSGQGAPSHFCDILGESSFKDIEEHARSGDLEKLFMENREQLETMRLALDSRHQGELEAQKELYETKLEELLRTMSESHTNELKLQNKHVQDMHNVETELSRKLSEAEEEISSLKQLLHINEKNQTDNGEQTKDVNQHGNSLSELESELQRVTDILKQKDSESLAQIASLKRKLRLSDEVMSKMEKDMSNLRSKYESDVQSLSSSVYGKVQEIEELNKKIQELSSCLEKDRCLRQQVECELNDKCLTLKEEYESKLRSKHEEYELKVSDLAVKHVEELHKKDLENERILEEKITNAVEKKKTQLEAEYTEYLEFVKKCADDTKIQLLQRHEDDIKQVIDKYEKQLSDLRKSHESSSVMDSQVAKVPGNDAQVCRPPSTLGNESFVKESILCDCLQELIKLADELSSNQQEQLEQVIIKLCKEQEQSQLKLHQDQEMRLHNVQSECERRFHLQLEEARGDIVKALEDQIQQLLDDNTDTVDKPLELQQLEKKFASKYLQKLHNMQKEYDAKILDLNQKHAAQLSLARNKTQSVHNTAISSEELEKLYKERDCLRNVAATLRDVVAELVRYFMSWEDDFNNTLMDELVKLEGGRDNDILSVTHQENSFVMEQSRDVVHQDSSTSEDEMPVIVATPAKARRFSTNIKRIHFAPDISGILSLIEDGSILEGVGLNCSLRDASLNFHEELDRCLDRLRSESAALYDLSKPALPTSLGKDSVPEVDDKKSEEKLSDKLADALRSVARLQKENEDLQNQLKTLHEEHEMSYAELLSNRMRVETLEHEARQQAEIVAEGYGEGDQSITCDHPGSPRATTVEELQSKARSLLLGVSNPEEISGVVSPNSSHHLPHIVEELCRDWERLAEESRHKQDDLQQQVEAADKQLRATRTFMDEQAAEREQEREDFVQEIKRLQELLRDKDRDRTSQQQMNHEVEILEGHLKESQSALQDTREKQEKLTAEHKQAVEKIWTLRDIISDLEVQVAAKAEEAATAAAQNEALQTMVEQQGRTQLELAQEMEELQLCSGNGRLVDHITQLEDQLRKHQVLAEQLGDPSAIDQMKVQLNDLGASLELHTRELECANASTGLPASPCLSSPSEDVSIRETLEAIRAAAEKKEEFKQPSSCVILPFSEVSQLVEHWQRHARADDAILKKLRDLDMQLDDVQAEKDALAARLQEQMLMSSSLQSKLDEHRRKADVKHSMATAEMQSQIEDLKSEIHNYADTLESREKQIENLRSSLRQVENDLRRREAEIRKSAEAERIIAAQLKIQVSKLSADKEKLQALLSEKDAMHGSLPALVESMLLDKNADIDRLEKQVLHLTKQMDVSSHYVATPSTTLEFEYVESEKVRAHVELSPVLELRRSLYVPAIDESSYGKGGGLPHDTSLGLMTRQMSFDAQMGPEVEVSLKPVPLEETVSESHSVQNSNSGNMSDTLSSLTGTFDTSSLSSCEKRVAALEEELEMKNKMLTDYLKQIDLKSAAISDLEQKCKHLEECEEKLTEMSHLEEELKTLKAKLQMDTNVMKAEFERMIEAKDLEIQQLKDQLTTIQNCTLVHQVEGEQSSEQPTTPQESSEMEAKDSEIQRLRNEVCATQSILANLQRKVQEAKQIARSPSRSSPDNNQALRIVQNELEVAKQEIVELKELCKSIRSEVEAEYQHKQTEFDEMLNHEQDVKQSLLESLENLRQENKMKELNNLEQQLRDAESKLMSKEEEAQKLNSELRHLNMECVTLKNQLSTPISEVTLLKSRLDAEKKFADALKEELLTFKNKASILDEECKLLKEHTRDLQTRLDATTKTQDESDKLLKEVSDLKSYVDSLLKDHSNYKEQIEKLSHENSVLKEENAEVGKELSDMKQVIIQMRGVKVSNKEAEKALQLKSNELNEVAVQMNTITEELSSLRKALKNIHSNIFDLPGLAEDDRQTLNRLQKHLITSNLRGAGDGPWNKLSVTETDIHEISPGNVPLKESESLDNLTGLVQHELDLSVQLDHSLLQTIDTRSNSKKPSSSSAMTQGKTMSRKVESSEVRVAGSLAETEGEQENATHHKIHQLEKELSQMKTSVQLLHDQLEAERAQYCKLQQQDCDLIEEMRLKLSEALDGQATLHLQLQSEFKRRKSSLSDVDTKEAHESTVAPKSSSYMSALASTEKLQEQLNGATSELLKLRVEKDTLEKQLRRLQEVEIQRSRRRAVTEEKHRRRIDQLQSLHSETQQECMRLHEELASVNQKLLFAQEEFSKDRDAQLKNHAPFVERLKNMNTFLEEHIEENVRMAKQMEELTEEHRKLRRKISQLEGQLAEKRNNESFEAMNAHFSAERTEWESEQKLLILALNEAKQKQMRSADSDVEERVSHLFGRYLRMQSYRKALVWQKRYLMSVISGINESKALTSTYLAACSSNVREKQLNPRRKFRSAVMVTMAIHRMQFMVERWLRGKRIGCGVVVQQTFSQYTISASSLPQGQQPIYTSSQSSLPTGELRSGLSQSPPTLERPRQPRSQPLANTQFSRLPLNSRGLTLTHNLSETVTNFNLVQQRFDALLSNPPK